MNVVDIIPFMCIFCVINEVKQIVIVSWNKKIFKSNLLTSKRHLIY